MNRRGIALLSTLWVIVLIGAVAATALAESRLALAAHRNRITLRRAAWAREACLEILLTRGASHVDDLAPVDLGRGTWCRVSVENPAAKLHLAHADARALRLLLGSDSLADAVLDWRDADDIPRPHGAERDWYAAAGRRRPRNEPLADVAELRLVRGFDSAAAARLGAFLTTHGDGRIDLGAAPAEVLATVPGFSPTAVQQILRLRGRHALGGLEQLAALLGREDRRHLLAFYAEAVAATTVRSTVRLAHVEAGVHGEPARDRMLVTLAPVGERLAVLRREPR